MPDRRFPVESAGSRWSHRAGRHARARSQRIALSCPRTANEDRIAAAVVERGIGPGEIVAVPVRKPVTHSMMTLGPMRVGAVSVSLTDTARNEIAALEGVSPVI